MQALVLALSQLSVSFINIQGLLALIANNIFSVILYMSEIAPKKVRGALVAGYQFCITIGILLANCVVYATQDRDDTGSYRIPVAIQFLWYVLSSILNSRSGESREQKPVPRAPQGTCSNASSRNSSRVSLGSRASPFFTILICSRALILGTGLFMLPESPRYFVKKGKLDAAARALASVRGQPIESEYIQDELAEIIANHEYELSVVPQTTYFASWANCFHGKITDPASNLRRTLCGIVCAFFHTKFMLWGEPRAETYPKSFPRNLQ